MKKNLSEAEFVIFDTETTGLDPAGGDRVVELAGIRLSGKKQVAVFQAMVNPHREISEAAFNVNHITVDMLKDAPEARLVIPEFLKFIQGSCLCSYNAGFDLGFLNNELKLIGLPSLEGFMVVDILKMARRLLPGLERYALWFVAQKLGINIQQQHRAFSDVELTLGVFNKLREGLDKKGDFGLEDFAGLFGVNTKFLNDIHNQKIAEIEEAIELGGRLKIRYISSSGSISEREVLPKEIRKENKRIYLVGHCCLRNEERSFRVDGILRLEML